jgi:CO dehydrogenase maturation factor
MKIALVGKGGSGKTTLSALLCRHLASQNHPVLAIDADINQHLGAALGMSEEEATKLPPMGLEIDRIKEYLRGNNALVRSNDVMTKTTPPGRGSRLVTVTEPNPIYDYFEREINGVRVLATGPFSESDLGLKCYHSKVGAVELLLNHMVDGPDEYVVVDMTAGADSFASGMFTKFDMTFLVAEPTFKGLSVYKQYKDYAKNYNVKVKVIGNKVEARDDVEFLKEHAGEDLAAWLVRSDFVRAMEKGRHLRLDRLEDHNLRALGEMKRLVDLCEKDWDKFYRQTVDFHIKNALGWANASAGEDLTEQVDPEFKLQPDLTAGGLVVS